MKTTAALAATLLAASVSALPHKPARRQESYGNGTANGAVWNKLRGNVSPRHHLLVATLAWILTEALQIKHVVYLMMENHSFDNIAGYWSFNDKIDNLRNINYCNNYTNPNWTVWNEPLEICAAPYETEVPLDDPDHNFAGVSYEIYQNYHPTNNDTVTMGGFIDRQSAKYNATPGDSAFVIKAYSEEKSHILATLAQNYGFWDSYHAEHPGPTNPNVSNPIPNSNSEAHAFTETIRHIGLDLWYGR